MGLAHLSPLAHQFDHARKVAQRDVGTWLGKILACQSALPQSVQYDLGPEPLKACLASAIEDGVSLDHPNVGRIEAVVENLEVAVGGG